MLGGICVATDRRRALELLAQARVAVSDFGAAVPKPRSGVWEPEGWEEAFLALAVLHREYGGLLERFGRDYLAAVTGRRVTSARQALLVYLQLKLGSWVTKEELQVVGGIGEWARRLRELRVQLGWPIETTPGVHSKYRLTDIRPNPSARKLWQTLNGIRKQKISAGDRMLSLLRSMMGREVSVEHLAYVARDHNWKDQLLRERRDYGRRISGPEDRPELGQAYLLESDDPLPDPDEWTVPPELRAQVLEADERTCTACGWEQDSTEDRWLEVHRRSPGNDLKDFCALCSVCHERLHAEGAGAVAIRLRRHPSVKAEDWQRYFGAAVPRTIAAGDAGGLIESMLLPAVRIAGQPLPHIREINGLRENQLWQERVGRVAAFFTGKFGPVWYERVGSALRPPLRGKPGDGFEQLIKYLIRAVSGRSAEANVQLGTLFPKEAVTDAKEIDVYVPPGPGPAAFLSLKWSLRDDRTRQVQLEAQSLHRMTPGTYLAVVTNEYDITRLRPLLTDPHIAAVYHVDLAAVRSMWAPEGEEALAQMQSLRDIQDLLERLREGL